MNLSGLLQLGFASRAHLAGADEAAQCPRWLAARQQSVLLDDLRKLADGLGKIDADENLTAAGKTAAKRQRGTEFLAGLESESGKKLLGLIVTKRDLAHAALRKAQQPAGQMDMDRLVAVLETQNMQRHLLSLKPELLLVELARAVENRNQTVYRAVVSFPDFILKDKGITRETLAAAEEQWSSKTCPTESAAAQVADVGLQVAEQDRDLVTRVVRAECQIEPPREVRITK